MCGGSLRHGPLAPTQRVALAPTNAPLVVPPSEAACKGGGTYCRLKLAIATGLVLWPPAAAIACTLADWVIMNGP